MFIPIWLLIAAAILVVAIITLLIWGARRSNTRWWAEGYWVGRHDEHLGEPIDAIAMRYMK